MPAVDANGVLLEYDTVGDPYDPPVLLIAGVGAQLLWWPDGFCELLASRGFWVIRYDNRDVGLSTKLDEAGVPDLAAIFEGAPAPYLLEDMADDAAALLDGIGVEAAHVVGASMGGMIAQLVAVRHPEKVLTLTSLSSSAGGEALVPPEAHALHVLVSPPGGTREEHVEAALRDAKVLAGRGFELDEAALRARTAAEYDRCHHPAGAARHLAAIVASPGRTAALGAIRVPALVVHGADDPLLPVANAFATAEAIPGAELLVIDGMGHDIPRGAWPQIVWAISILAGRVRRSSASS